MSYINTLFSLFSELVKAGSRFTFIIALVIVCGLFGGISSLTRRMFDFTKVNRDE